MPRSRRYSPPWWAKLSDHRLRYRRMRYIRIAGRASAMRDLHRLKQAIALVSLCDRELAFRVDPVVAGLRATRALQAKPLFPAAFEAVEDAPEYRAHELESVLVPGVDVSHELAEVG